MKKNILTGLIVIGFLLIIGADSYLVFTQILGPIIPVVTSVLLTIPLTLIVSHLMSRIQFKEKDATVDISKGYPDNYDVDTSNSKKDHSKKNKDKNGVITI